MHGENGLRHIQNRRTVSIDTQDLTQPPNTLYTSQRCFRIDRRDISFLRFVLEAYEGVAVLTTVDTRNGVVSVRIAPGSEGLVAELLDALCANGDILMEPLPDVLCAAQGEA
jgi:hypothetical protein